MSLRVWLMHDKDSWTYLLTKPIWSRRNEGYDNSKQANLASTCDVLITQRLKSWTDDWQKETIEKSKCGEWHPRWRKCHLTLHIRSQQFRVKRSQRMNYCLTRSRYRQHLPELRRQDLMSHRYARTWKTLLLGRTLIHPESQTEFQQLSHKSHPLIRTWMKQSTRLSTRLTRMSRRSRSSLM